MIRIALVLVIPFLAAGCIGTDEVNDPFVEKNLTIFPDRIALLVGNTIQATSVYTNNFGIEEEVVIAWSTSPASIATVDENGKVTAVAPGQAMLFASAHQLKDSVRIAVVLDENSAASVDISAPKTTLAIGESIDLTWVVKNINDEPISASMVSWHSSNESVVQVNTAGMVTAIGNGTANIFAVVDGVFSNEILITVGGIRLGTFVGANGYNASGMTVLELDNGELILTFSDDFMTNFALGTFVYLANNNTSGTAIKSAGIELSEITVNGAHTFNVTALFPNTTLSQYQYVIILCKPASIPFGYAQLN